MKGSIIVTLLFLITDGSRAFSSEFDQELPDEDLPVREQLADLNQQNLLSSITEEKPHLDQDLERLQMASSWNEGWEITAANGTADNKTPVMPSLQTSIDSFVKVDDLTVTVNNRTKAMEEHKNDVIRKLVRTYNQHRVWRSLRTGLDAVMDHESSVYAQLRKLGYDQKYPLKKLSKESGWETLLDALLEAGLDADMVAGPNDYTMLHYATGAGLLDVAETLIRHGAHLEMRNDYRRTPLVLMAAGSHLVPLKLLVERGAYINSVDADGRSSLHYAVIQNNLEMAQFLVDNGALTALTDNSDKTPKYYGSRNNVGEYLAQFDG